MRVTALTASGLEKIIAGVVSNFAGSDLFEQVVDRGGAERLHLYYTAADTADSPLILIRNSEGDSFLPLALRGQRQASLERVLAFAQRARTMPIVIPSSWKPYRSHDLVGFFVSSAAATDSPRWVSQVRLNGSHDIALWEVTTTQDKQTLNEFVVPENLYKVVRVSWESNLDASIQALQGPMAKGPSSVEVTLDESMPTLGLSKSKALSDWLPNLTSSQKEFVDALSDRSIRLRGPGGSGKTLTMAIKAVQEAQRAKENNENTRILFATHSWSLAGEVDDLIRSLSEYGDLDNITVLPLISVAEEILPTGMIADGLELIGDDSLSGKTLQLAQIREIVDEFRRSDWITYAEAVSKEFRQRMEYSTDEDAATLVWDLLIEFGCVLGADGIFPSFNAETRYLRLPRAPWMMALPLEADKRVVYAIYERWWIALQERSLITSDQLLNDFLNYLETFAWNHRRQNEGYDLIFVDEFHLFNIQERQTLRYLSRDTGSFPRIFMALDPRQSPWEIYTSAGMLGVLPVADEQDSLRTVDIPTVHRLSPQILDLVKQVHLDFPNLDLGGDWDLAISDVESLANSGPKPSLFLSDTHSEEEIAIYRHITEIYPSGSQFAVAVVDETRFPKYMSFMSSISESGKFKVVPLTSRDDVGLLKRHKRGVVVGPAEYLAGLQFDTVIIAGLPDMNSSFANQSYRKRRDLSLLYLALTRASRDVRIFVNEESGGIPKVLARAKDQGSLGIFRA